VNMVVNLRVGASWIEEQLSASQEGLCSMYLLISELYFLLILASMC
jgi:hypothetical protein